MYQFICPTCGGRSFSASKIATLKNPECPYCGSPLAQDSQQISDNTRTAENDTTSGEPKQVPDAN